MFGQKSTVLKELLAAVLLLGLSGRADAAALVAPERAEARAVTAGIHVSPPFAMQNEEDDYGGMALDLWEEVAGVLNLRTRYVPYPSVESLLQALESGDIDVTVTNLTVTHERAQRLEFTYPWYDAGLRIMVKDRGGASVLTELAKNGHLYAYAWLGALILAATVAATAFRRRSDPKFSRSWKEGLAKSFYDLIVAVKGGALNSTYLGWVGYVLSALWMIAGVALIAYITSSVTSTMTTVSLSDTINSLNDLPGKKVGVLRGSTSQQVLQAARIDTIPFDAIDGALEALDGGLLDAIVGDAPVLEYEAHIRPQANLKVVGNIFHPDKYAFAFAKMNAQAADRVSLELIRFHESGKLREIRTKYFGRMNL